MSDDQTTFTHAGVIDAEGNKLGVVSDVISDNNTLEPRWLVVDVGVLHTSHYVPASGAYRTVEGEVMVPFTKEIVKESPRVHKSHVISPDDERELIDYYGLTA
jgi:ribosomal 30S subunit maturation factor RimM